MCSVQFFIEPDVDEKWIHDYLDSISERSDQRNPKDYQQLGTGGGGGGFEPMALEMEERLVPERKSSETKTKIKKKSYMKRKLSSLISTVIYTVAQ